MELSGSALMRLGVPGIARVVCLALAKVKLSCLQLFPLSPV
jgi:hypothetical protein